MARGAKERPVTGTLVLVPKIRTSTIVLARVRITLVFAWTAGLCIYLFNPAVFLDVHLGDFHVVDNDVLDAADKRRGVVGQYLLVTNDSSDEGVEVHCVIIPRRINGLGNLEPIVDAESQIGSIDSNINLLPLGIIQILADQDTLIFADEVRVKIQLSIFQL